MDHALREESPEDTRFVEQYTRELGIPCHIRWEAGETKSMQFEAIFLPRKISAAFFRSLRRPPVQEPR